MPVRCPCGNENPDESVFCNKCGKELQRREGPRTCSRCGSANPSHVVYCGGCGADLEAGFAKSIPSEKLQATVPGEAYFVHQRQSALLGSTSSSMTKPQYWFWTIVGVIAALVGAVVLAIYAHPLAAAVYLLFLLGVIYASWRSVRENA